MTKHAVLASGFLAVLVVGCGYTELGSDPGSKGRSGPTGTTPVSVSGSGGAAGEPGGGVGGSGATSTGGSGTGGSSHPPVSGTGGALGSAALAGIWFGNVKMEHPDFYGPPIDQMTIELSADGALSFVGFTGFGYEASFGTPPAALPLTGTALAHVVGNGFYLRFTVVTADWQSDHFAFTYKAHSDGLGLGESPETPYTDLTVALTGTLVDGKLRVHWTEQGKQYTAPLQAVADGDLSR